LAIDKVPYILELAWLRFIRTDSVTEAENLKKKKQRMPPRSAS
jgi:hypothetical protein